MNLVFDWAWGYKSYRFPLIESTVSHRLQLLGVNPLHETSEPVQTFRVCGPNRGMARRRRPGAQYPLRPQMWESPRLVRSGNPG